MSEKSKKPATSLDDLKARLGLTGETAKVSDPSEKPKASVVPPREPPPPVPNLPPLPEEPGEVEPEPEAVDPPPRLEPEPSEKADEAVTERSEPAEKMPAQEPSEELPSAEEEPSPLEEEEPAVGLTADKEAQAPPLADKESALHVPVSDTTKMAFIGGLVILFLLTLMFGYLFGNVQRDRKVASEVINETTHMLRLIYEGQGDDDRSTPARQLEDFQRALSEVGDDYTTHEDHMALYQPFMANGGDLPVITSRQLEGAKILLTTTEGHASQLVDYVLATQLLSAMIQEHIEGTLQDHALGNFDRLLSGEDNRQYLVHFDNRALGEAYDDFIKIESPELSQFSLPTATVIPYDHVELVNAGSSDEPRYVYRVSEAERLRDDLRLYNILGITQEQLLVTGTEETALDRYAHRTSVIREKLGEVMHIQQQLEQSLENRVSPDE